MRFTSTDLERFGVVDEVIEEPLGGAHRNHHQTAARMKLFLLRSLRELKKQKPEQLLEHRYDRFRQLGVFWEGSNPELADPNLRLDPSQPIPPPKTDGNS